MRKLVGSEGRFKKMIEEWQTSGAGHFRRGWPPVGGGRELREMLDAHAKAFRENYCEGMGFGTAAWWKRYKSTKNWMRENGWLRSDPVRVMADTLVALHNLKRWQPPDDRAPH